MDLNAILILCLLSFIYIIVKIPTKKKTKKSTGREPLEAEESSKVDYTEMYQKRYLLTIHEKTEYNKIKRVAEKLDLLLFTKVRLVVYQCQTDSDIISKKGLIIWVSKLIMSD